VAAPSGPEAGGPAPGARGLLSAGPAEGLEAPVRRGAKAEPSATAGVELAVPSGELGGAGGRALRRPVVVRKGESQRAEPAPAHEAEMGGGRAEDGGEELSG
jgi:hypothetical protein